ncbi:hypothetical protein [Williamsia sp. CHRR-6]|uniref:hypothetical protein n=1 Tax=Williamsia sp. CHRR-6 TaxID=2835871 RepID=UPI001BDA4496|nr:hypothetical protein [Williamsia sp. CHRR-6]MBT0567144.1 hypothetical protein [Williamsia sp. CHRR-6]
MDSVTLRPRSALIAAGLVGLMAVVATVLGFASGVRLGVSVLTAMLLVCAVVWMLLANPCVQIDDRRVTVVNPLRTFVIDLQSIVTVETRFALTIRTADETVVAWSASAPSGRDRVLGGSTSTPDAKSVPRSAIRADGTVSPGDLPGSASGDAATELRRRWESARGSGALDGLPITPVAAHWNVASLAAVVFAAIMMTAVAWA